VSLRGSPVRERAVLPDGRQVDVVVGVPDDDYVPPRELDTVTIELRDGDEVLAVLDTVLDADEESEARALAREVAAKLASGELEPTAEAIEPLADTLR
jgi:multidrug efflux pump subunit AcrB